MTGKRLDMRLDLPPLPWTGGCQCGAVRYRITGMPVVFYHCHCAECQRQSSSAHGQSLRLLAGDVEITGTVSTMSRPADSGHDLEGLFCPGCGTRVLHRRAGRSETVNIKAGTLDETGWLVPAGHIWTRSAQAGTRFYTDDLIYDTMPPDEFAALNRRWRTMIGED